MHKCKGTCREYNQTYKTSSVVMSDEKNPTEVKTEENSAVEAPKVEATAPVESSEEKPATEQETVEATAPAETAETAAPAEATATEESTADSAAENAAPAAEAAKEPAPEEPSYDAAALNAELREKKAKRETIEVEGLRRVRGGILVSYKNMHLFLPTSHLSLKSNPSENELLALLRKSFEVHVHEIAKDESSRVIVTRRWLLRKERVKDVKVGEVVEGKVSSLTEFGAFVNIGDVDGMVHVSRISRNRVDKPSDVLKKGDVVKVVVKDVDASKGRISLSMKELEPSPWDEVESKIKAGDQFTGKIKSITDFGAYVEVAPGLEGLVHVSELSWARRLKTPREMFKNGQDMDVQVISVSAQDKKISLSHKLRTENPWDKMEEVFPIGSTVKGKVKELLQRGAVIELSGEVDAFMPKGKMHPDYRTNKKKLELGEELELSVMDVVPDNQSLIVGMSGFDQTAEGEEKKGRPRSGGRKQGGGGGGRRANIPQDRKSNSNVTLMDLLSEEERKKLFGDENS